MEEQLALALAKIMETATNLSGYAPLVIQQIVMKGLFDAHIEIMVGWGLIGLGVILIVLGALGASVWNWYEGHGACIGLGITALLIGAVLLIIGHVDIWKWTNVPELMIVRTVLNR